MLQKVQHSAPLSAESTEKRLFRWEQALGWEANIKLLVNEADT
ncbi:hypothetical protein [Paenibacillus macerans]